MAAHPDVGNGAARPDLHRGDVDRNPRGAHRRRRAAGPRVTDEAPERAAAAAPREIETGLPRRVEKPWGQELIWAVTDRYVGKIIAIEAGKRLSLQYHERKDEWIHVLSGRLRLTLENDAGVMEDRDLGPGDGAHVPTGRRHRYTGVD